MFVLHEGPGTWDGTIVNSTNPMRRDVALVRGNGHIVLQFNSTNPGKLPPAVSLPPGLPSSSAGDLDG
jgi:hypothetical protein